jgi:hypothetical protein
VCVRDAHRGAGLEADDHGGQDGNGASDDDDVVTPALLLKAICDSRGHKKQTTKKLIDFKILFNFYLI